MSPSNGGKTAIDFTELSRRLKNTDLPEVDVVVGIGSGGTVPAALVAHQLNKDLKILTISFRDEDNHDLYAEPLVLQRPELGDQPLRILLVDEVSVTGKTMHTAKEALKGHHLTTLVCKGKGDIVIFPEVRTCVLWPWKG